MTRDDKLKVRMLYSALTKEEDGFSELYPVKA